MLSVVVSISSALLLALKCHIGLLFLYNSIFAVLLAGDILFLGIEVTSSRISFIFDSFEEEWTVPQFVAVDYEPSWQHLHEVLHQKNNFLRLNFLPSKFLTKVGILIIHFLLSTFIFFMWVFTIQKKSVSLTAYLFFLFIHKVVFTWGMNFFVHELKQVQLQEN